MSATFLRATIIALALSALASVAADAPNISRRELPQYRSGDGPIPVIATDRDARFDAFVRVLEFLKSRLESN